MSWATARGLRRLNLVTHRDLGYFVSALTITYCLSGVALNHVDVWNPDFVIHKREVTVPTRPSVDGLTEADLAGFDALVGEPRRRLVDYPTRTQAKLYYEQATLHVNLVDGTGNYERISRRPMFYSANVIHRNSFKPWRWFADVFAVLLALVGATGVLVLRGKNGLGGRGKWLMLAGAAPPVIALLLHG